MYIEWFLNEWFLDEYIDKARSSHLKFINYIITGHILNYLGSNISRCKLNTTSLKQDLNQKTSYTLFQEPF